MRGFQPRLHLDVRVLNLGHAREGALENRGHFSGQRLVAPLQQAVIVAHVRQPADQQHRRSGKRRDQLFAGRIEAALFGKGQPAKIDAAPAQPLQRQRQGAVILLPKPLFGLLCGARNPGKRQQVDRCDRQPQGCGKDFRHAVHVGQRPGERHPLRKAVLLALDAKVIQTPADGLTQQANTFLRRRPVGDLCLAVDKRNRRMKDHLFRMGKPPIKNRLIFNHKGDGNGVQISVHKKKIVSVAVAGGNLRRQGNHCRGHRIGIHHALQIGKQAAEQVFFHGKRHHQTAFVGSFARTKIIGNSIEWRNQLFFQLKRQGLRYFLDIRERQSQIADTEQGKRQAAHTQPLPPIELFAQQTDGGGEILAFGQGQAQTIDQARSFSLLLKHHPGNVPVANVNPQ